MFPIETHIEKKLDPCLVWNLMYVGYRAGGGGLCGHSSYLFYKEGPQIWGIYIWMIKSGMSTKATSPKPIMYVYMK